MTNILNTSTNFKENKKVYWGDIYYCDFGESVGSVQSGYRPVVVLQTNALNKNSPTVLVALITSVIKKPDMNTHVLIGKEYGLKTDSMILLEQIRTIDKNLQLREYVGHISNFDLKNAIKRGVKYAMSIPTKPPIKRKGYILTLCPTCSKEYYSSGDFVIKRMDSFQVEKFICENCRTEYGYDYFVSKKQKAEERNKYE